MKKLIVIVAVAVVAFAANASTVKWSIGATYQAGSTSLLVDGGTTAYIINAATLTQQAVLTAYAGGTSLADIVAGKTLSDGSFGSDGKVAAISVTTTSIYTDASVQSFFVVFENSDTEELFLSASKNVTIKGTGDSLATFLTSTASKAAAIQSSTFADPGWYSAVPEPTSGLLVMLGVGLMALRRRRA